MKIDISNTIYSRIYIHPPMMSSNPDYDENFEKERALLLREKRMKAKDFISSYKENEWPNRFRYEAEIGEWEERWYDSL